MSQLEWLAAALVLTNVALVALRSVWNYPFALAAVTLYAFVFFEAKLYSDMLLQGFFFALNLYGWAAWMRAREGSDIPVGWMTARARWIWGRHGRGVGRVECGDAPFHRCRCALDRRRDRDDQRHRTVASCAPPS